MPYKGLDALKAKITDPVVRKWADTLKPKSRTKLFTFLQFWDWAREVVAKDPQTGVEKVRYWRSGEELLADYDRCALPTSTPEEKFRHLTIAMEFVKSKGTSPSDRRITMSSIRAFYRKNLRPLQELDKSEKDEIYAPGPGDRERSIELSRVLTPIDIALVVRAAKMPYQAIFLVMFQGGMDADAFMQFNSRVWNDPKLFDMKALGGRGSVKIDGLVRSKTEDQAAARGGQINVYYTYISEDAKMKIRQWLQIRDEMLKKAGKSEWEYLFFNWRRGGRQRLKTELTPITTNTIGKTVTTLIKRLGLVTEPPKGKRSSRTRYYFHGHEMRDCFRSLCTPVGMNKVASEFFTGHEIDKLHYDKSPHDPNYFDFYRSEYRKVMRNVDILSNPPTAEGKAQKKETMAMINRQHMLLAHVPRERVDRYSEEELAAMTPEEVRREIRNADKGGRSETDGDGWEPGQQKVVAAVSLREWVERGWHYVDSIPTTGEVVIRYPSSS
jgi:hypothetical protein